MSDLEYQMRNWYNFTWLCGDHIVEQHVHNLDVMNWAHRQRTRSSAVGMGGRHGAPTRSTATSSTTSPSTTSTPTASTC